MGLPRERSQQHLVEFFEPGFGRHIGNAGDSQIELSLLFRVAAEKILQIIMAASELGKVDERTPRPQIRFPFASSWLVESKAYIPPDLGSQPGQPFRLPWDFHEPGIMPVGRILSMQHEMPDFVKNSKDVFTTGLVGIY